MCEGARNKVVRVGILTRRALPSSQSLPLRPRSLAPHSRSLPTNSQPPEGRVVRCGITVRPAYVGSAMQPLRTRASRQAGAVLKKPKFDVCRKPQDAQASFFARYRIYPVFTGWSAWRLLLSSSRLLYRWREASRRRLQPSVSRRRCPRDSSTIRVLHDGRQN